MQSRRQLRILCDLDDHILQDIALSRAALRCEAKKPFWQQNLQLSLAEIKLTTFADFNAPTSARSNSGIAIGGPLRGLP
jgi:hypothetical protein